MAKISFYGADGEERSYKLHPQLTLRVGRDPGNDVVLRDPKVSRRHAEVVFERGFFVLHDLQSANGTYMNGRRINVAPLMDGAELKLGNSQGRFDDDKEVVPEGTVMATERPEPKSPRPGTAEMPQEEWQTHPHKNQDKQADYKSPPSQSAMDMSKQVLADAIGETSIMEDEADDSDPERPELSAQKQIGHRFELERGVPWGELTSVYDDESKASFFYRRTFNLVGFVSSTVSALILLAGLVVAVFLAIDASPLLAGVAMGITFIFTAGILVLVPKRQLLVFADEGANIHAMQIRESSLPGLPNLAFEIQGADGTTIGYLRKRSIASIIARRWSILGPNEEIIAVAKEDGLVRPFFRKLLGDSFGLLTTNYSLESNGSTIGTYRRRSNTQQFQTLELDPHECENLDTRMLLAFAFTMDLVEKSR